MRVLERELVEVNMRIVETVTRAQWRPILDTTAAFAMIVASAALVWAIVSSRQQQSTSTLRPPRPGAPKPLPVKPVSLHGAPILGLQSAPVAVIQFSDYECSFCARFHRSSFPALRKSYIDTGKVLFALRHLPLQKKHPLAFHAAVASECSGRVGKFWEMHDQLFSVPTAIDEASILSKARQVGVDSSEFRLCAQGGAGAAEKIEADIRQARELGITATPSFLIGRVQSDGTISVQRHESGAIPTPVFAKMLDEALQSANVDSR